MKGGLAGEEVGGLIEGESEGWGMKNKRVGVCDGCTWLWCLADVRACELVRWFYACLIFA